MSISDARLYLRLYARLRPMGELLRGRARRVRNSLVHGNPVHSVILDSVKDISDYRVHSALDLALESFASSISVANAAGAPSQGARRAVAGATAGDLPPRPLGSRLKLVPAAHASRTGT
jgi:hypothetical protein